MKTITNTAWTLSGALILTAAIGCQGDPFNRESNPVKDYRVAQEKAIKYIPGQKPPQPVDPDNNQYVCFEPVKISVKGDRGERLLEFVENQEATYEITVISLLDDGEFEIKPSGPAGLQFIRLSKKDNVAIYKLGWRPKKVRSAKGVDNFTLNLNYLSKLANKRCGSDIRVSMNLQVVKTPDVPTLFFEGLPQTALTIGDQFDFKIVVDDPASLIEMAPVLQKIYFSPALNNGERTVLNATRAVKCETTGKSLGEGKFSFNCKFDSRKIDFKSVLDQEGSVETAFLATAVSKRSKKSTGPISAIVTFNLPKKPGAAESPAPTFSADPNLAYPDDYSVFAKGAKPQAGQTKTQTDSE